MDVSFTGLPVTVRWRTGLLDTAGNPAHAATFIRKRLVLLDRELQGNRPEYHRIYLHEMFHFAWVRLGNPKRLEWEALLRRERDARARGEAGWSAEWRKLKLTNAGVQTRSRAWREYCCESFCDTAACIFGNSNVEVTLSPQRLSRRRIWFKKEFATGCIPI